MLKKNPIVGHTLISHLASMFFKKFFFYLFLSYFLKEICPINILTILFWQYIDLLGRGDCLSSEDVWNKKEVVMVTSDGQRGDSDGGTWCMHGRGSGEEGYARLPLKQIYIYIYIYIQHANNKIQFKFWNVCPFSQIQRTMNA